MEDTSPFTPADHTALVAAVLEHPLHVIKYLEVPPDQTPTTLQVLDAALRVKSFDSDTKWRLRAARNAHVTIEEARRTTTQESSTQLERIRSAVSHGSVTEMIAALEEILHDTTLEVDERTTIENAQAILIDGAGTIYSPTYPPNELLESSSDAPTPSVAQADATALAEGTGVAVSAMASPLLGVPYAAGTSAATAVVAVLETVFG